MLTALGKRFDALRFERATRRAWELVEIWFQAEAVRHLFVLRSAHVKPALLRNITDMGLQHGAEVWHIGAGGGGGDWPHSRWNPLTFRARWSGAVAEETNEFDADFPEIPDDDFLTFRWSCWRLLDAPRFKRVDRCFCEAMDTTDEWLHPRIRFDRGQTLGADEAAAQLQALLISAASPAEALTRLRGAQAAYFRAGWLLEFPASQDGKSAGIVPLGPSLDPTMARRLRRLCTPRSTAALALALATDLRADGMSRLNIADVHHDGAGIAIGDGDHQFTVPNYARSLLRALVIERRLAGAVELDGLFIDPKTGERITTDRMTTMLRRLSGNTGIAVGLLGADRSQPTLSHWLSRRRLRVWPLKAQDVMGQ